MESSASPRLREQARTVMRLHHYRVRTESPTGFAISYVFINCDNRRNSVPPRSMPFSPGLSVSSGKATATE